MRNEVFQKNCEVIFFILGKRQKSKKAKFGEQGMSNKMESLVLQ